MLHITNGDATAGTLRRTGLPGTVVAWRDVLHEGPVPAGLLPEGLRVVRARYLAGLGWGDQDRIAADLLQRDQLLAAYRDHEELVLWFEHDLYDQLQLIQILDRLAPGDPGATRRSVICVDAYPGIESFHGLGQLGPAQLAGLFETRRPITEAELTLGQAAWAAFTAAEPGAIETLLHTNTGALPFLGAALQRHMEQFPAIADGLSRTERQILEAIADGAGTPAAVFLAQQGREERPFMGDRVVWALIAELGSGETPLLARDDGRPFTPPAPGPQQDTFLAQRLMLTDAGQAVLAGRTNRAALRGIDRWLGGVHIRTAAAI